ncbi:hypothetical protein [Staphylococcus epidermidis]|nr:hypothetical protein [Staphylococcus epidermidis]
MVERSMGGMDMSLNFEEVKGKSNVRWRWSFGSESVGEEGTEMGVERGMN